MHTFLQICGLYSLIGFAIYAMFIFGHQREVNEKPFKWLIFITLCWPLIIILAFMIAWRNSK